VLRAARDARVKRVVLTSSFAAIGYGHKQQNAPFDESTWTDLAGYGATPYIKSKTLAERAAWDFVAKEGGVELAVVNPVAIFGPVLSPDYSPSIMIVQRMMDGTIPGCPQRWFGVVDVRDVADLHVRAMTHPAARGERFLCTAGDFMSMLEIAKVLKARMGAAGAKVPTRQLPNWLVRLAALRDPALKQLVPELGKPKNGTNAKARGLLGWKPRSSADAIVASAASLIRLGLLQDTARQAA
ncbi:MAG: NAD-dependent epimerase/dehydratase family protein, partial [Steroidobacteraceae bacterium]